MYMVDTILIFKDGIFVEEIKLDNHPDIVQEKKHNQDLLNYDQTTKLRSSQ